MQITKSDYTKNNKEPHMLFKKVIEEMIVFFLKYKRAKGNRTSR